jgi:hypothetical protein
MKPHERQYLSDNLARGFALMKQVKRVRGRRVICECNGQIATQRLGQEAVDGFVQVRKFVSACSHNEQGRVRRKIID